MSENLVRRASTFLIQEMGSSASKCFCFLLFISFVFLLFNFELLETALNLTNRAKKVEITGVGDVVGFHVLSKFRMLLGLNHYRSRPRKQQHASSSPAPAPVHEAAASAAHTPLLHTPINTGMPLSHRNHVAPGRSTEYRREDGGKAGLRRTAIAVLAVVGASLVVLGLTIAVLLKRSRKFHKSCLRPLKLFCHGSRTQRSPTAVRKVSSHPSPDLLCLSSLKQASESKSGELIKSEHIVSCLDEENLGFENSHSFHSVSCSRSSNPSLAEFSLQISVQTTTNLSPSSPHSDNPSSDSSYKSLSPVFRSRSSVIHKPSHSSPRKSEVEKIEVPHTDNNQERPYNAFSGSKFQKPPPELRSPSIGVGISPSTTETTSTLSNTELLWTPKESSRAPTEAAKLALTSKGSAPKPPPPSLKGHNSGQPPPPPPPLPLQIQVGKDGSPLPRLKPLHWDKVRAAPNRAMVWDDIRSSSFEFELDEQTIKSLFAYNFQGLAKNEDTKSKTQSTTSKHVMEHHKLQNTTILLKTLNASTEQVCNSIIHGAGLSVQQLEALVKMKPTKEEEEKLLNYDSEIDKLDPAEKFVKMVLTIPMAFSRMEAMLYKENFQDEVAHLKMSFAMIEGACRELRSSKLFLRLLEAVLKTGNRMNVGTIRGGARAFRLDALLKLADVRGADGKTTLLHFVVQEMVRSKGSKASEKPTGTPREDTWAIRTELISELSNELGAVKKAASIDLDTLVNSISNLSCGMAQLRNLVEKDLPDDDKNTSFSECMKSFLNHAEQTMKELKDTESRVLIHVREIIEYYHGEGGEDESNPLHIFVIVKDFLGLLDRVCREMRSSKHNPPLNLVLPFR